LKISIEELIELITREVISELTKLGIVVEFDSPKNVLVMTKTTSTKTSIEIDMSNYRTPVLTENNLSMLDSSVTEIIIPVGTIITPNARDIIRKKKLIITHKNKSN
jgi:hypothetical protein